MNGIDFEVYKEKIIEMEEIKKQLEEFGDYGGYWIEALKYWDNPPALSWRESDAFRDSVEITEDTFKFTAALPGVKKEDIELSVKQSVLYLKVLKDYPFVSKVERFYSVKDFDVGTIKTNLADGVLEIKMEKKEEEKPKKITI